MKKIKLCCFTVNSTHACIIANNFITNELENFKVIYINERSEKRKVRNMINKFYKKMEDNMYYTEWLNEKITHNYSEEKFVFVVYGKEEFVRRVNKYLELTEADGYVINCYEIFDVQNPKVIISEHDYYINTTGVVRKERLK